MTYLKPHYVFLCMGSMAFQQLPSLLLVFWRAQLVYPPNWCNESSIQKKEITVIAIT